MVTSLSPLKATYPRQSLALIVAHVLVGCCVSLGISRGARISGTLAQTPKVIKKKKRLTSHYENQLAKIKARTKGLGTWKHVKQVEPLYWEMTWRKLTRLD
jgi:hypothetical protein